MKKFSDFFAEEPDNTIMSVDRDDQKIYQRPKEPRRPLRLRRPTMSGYRDNPATIERPLRDLMDDPGSPPAQFGDSFGDVLDRETNTAKEQDEFERRRLVRRLGLEDRFGADHPLRDKLGNVGFVRAMQNPRVLDHFLEVDRLKARGNPAPVKSSDINIYNRYQDYRRRLETEPPGATRDRLQRAVDRGPFTGGQQYPRTAVEQKGIWDKLNLDDEENFEEYLGAISKLLGGEDVGESEVSAQLTKPAYAYRGRGKRELPIEVGPELLGKYFDDFTPEEISQFPDGLDFSRDETRHLLQQLKKNKITGQDFNEYHDFLDFAIDDIPDYNSNGYNKTVKIDSQARRAALLHRMQQSDDTTTQKFVDNLTKLSKGDKDEIEYAIEAGTLIPHPAEAANIIDAAYNDFYAAFDNVPWSQRPPNSPLRNLHGVVSTMAKKIDEIRGGDGHLDFGTVDEDDLFKGGKDYDMGRYFLGWLAMTENSVDAFDNFTQEDLIGTVPGLVEDFIKSQKDAGYEYTKSLKGIESAYDEVVDTIDDLLDENENDVWFERDDDNRQALSADGILELMYDELSSGLSWPEMVESIKSQREEIFNELQAEAERDNDDYRRESEEEDGPQEEGFSRDLLNQRPRDLNRMDRMRMNLLVKASGFIRNNQDLVGRVPPEKRDQVRRRGENALNTIIDKQNQMQPGGYYGETSEAKDKGAEGDFTSFTADVFPNPNHYGIHRIPTLDADLKKAGLTRHDLHSAAYIAWGSRPNVKLATEKYKEKYNKDPDVNSEEFRNFAKRLGALDAVKTWKAEVLPNLTPGTTVYNTPISGGAGGDMRANLYGRMGFGKSDHLGQHAVVGKDGKLYPLNPHSPASLGRNDRRRKDARRKRREAQNKG